MKAIMIRVGIDKSSGGWNARCNLENRDFVYVPVPSEAGYADPSMDRYYAEDVTEALERFSTRNQCHVSMPASLRGKSAHLDPDFRVGYLSYGSYPIIEGSGKKYQQGVAMRELSPGDYVIFYNSMQPVSKPDKTGNLVYGIIGILKVRSVKQVSDITDEAEIQANIHTRRPYRVPTDVVVYGEPEKSGRLEKYLPIGVYEARKKKSQYYIKQSLADEWGGVSHKYIQRAMNPVNLHNPIRFFEWWEQQNPTLMHTNNP